MFTDDYIVGDVMCSRKIIEGYLKKTLTELCRDGIIDVNQYQADDFEDLFDRVVGDLQ